MLEVLGSVFLCALTKSGRGGSDLGELEEMHLRKDQSIKNFRWA